MRRSGDISAFFACDAPFRLCPGRRAKLDQLGKLRSISFLTDGDTIFRWTACEDFSSFTAGRSDARN
jgi:hypothetical protein